MKPAYKVWTGDEMLDVLSVRVDEDDEIVSVETIYGQMTNNYALLPYAGFLDVKGNPIYTGDVLTVLRKTSPMFIAATLVGVDGHLRSLTHSSMIKQYKTLEDLHDSGVKFEVMGNMYQNPELLHLYSEEDEELGRV